MSGKSNLILISSLDNKALSNESFLLVAHISIVLLLLSNESIFLNKVDTIHFEASCVSILSLDTAKESISSINITD